VHFESDHFDTSAAQRPMGNMAMGNVQSFSGMITAIMPGQARLYMVATFEDATLEQLEIRIPFDIYISDWGGGGGDFGGPGGGFERPPFEVPDGAIECPECGMAVWLDDDGNGECWMCGWVHTSGSDFNWLLWVVIPAAVVVVGVVTALIIRGVVRKRKQFGGEQYDELDDF